MWNREAKMPYLAIPFVVAICLILVFVDNNERDKERRAMRQYAREIAECAEIYRAHKFRNFPYEREMAFSLEEELKKFENFLSGQNDTVFANRMRMATRLYIHNRAGIPARVSLAKA